MKSLSDLPNIGKELAEKLMFANILIPDELKFIGSKKAFMRIKTIYPDEACINMLYAFEGAIQGIRWHQLDLDTKTDLLDFYHSL